MPRPDWRDQAACRHHNPDLFYPRSGDMAAVKQAKQVCRSCPVKDECLADAITHAEIYGIWGGTSPKQRPRIRRAQQIAALVAERFPSAAQMADEQHGTARAHSDIRGSVHPVTTRRAA